MIFTNFIAQGAVKGWIIENITIVVIYIKKYFVLQTCNSQPTAKTFKQINKLQQNFKIHEMLTFLLMIL